MRAKTLSDVPVKDDPDWASYSSLALHRSCPQAWHYRYLRGLYPVREEEIAPERDFGIWWHALRAADSIMRGRKYGTLIVERKEIGTPDGCDDIGVEGVEDLVTAVFQGAEAHWEAMKYEEKDEWVARLGEDLPTRLRALNDRYLDEYAEQRRTEHPLAVELKWVREAVEGKVLLGYVDEVYLDTERRLVVARDHKTSKGLGTQSTADDMMDSQLHFYAWGAHPMLKEHGYTIQAVAYDRVRSTKAKTPRVTQAGSLGKTVTDFDLHTYLEWAKGEDGKGVPFPGRYKDGSGAGFYQAEQSEIERLSSPAARSAWFQRTLTPLNRNVITTHLRSGLVTMEDCKRTAEQVAETGAAGRNLGGACRWCDYAKLCRAQMVGGVEGEYVLEDYALVGP